MTTTTETATRPPAALFDGLPPIFADTVTPGYEFRGQPMDRPLRQGDYVYVTDSRICVRVRIADLPPEVATRWTAAPEDARPNCGSIFAKLAVDAAPTPFPADVDPAMQVETCDDCGGSGLTICESCEHEGKCGDCNGSGQQRKLDHVTLGDVVGGQVAHRFFYCYLAVLRLHGVAEVYLPTVVGGLATFRDVWEGIAWEGVMTTVDPKAPTQ